MAGELCLPLPDLDGEAGGLPALPDAGAPLHGGWHIGENCPSIGAGGHCHEKKVGLQAYHIINNVVRNLQRVPAGGLRDFCRLLAASGVHVPAWTATGLTSALTAVRWPTVKAQGRRTHIPEPTFGTRGADAATASAAPAEASHILAVPAIKGK